MTELEENLFDKYQRINEIVDRQKEIERMSSPVQFDDEWMLLQYEAEELWGEIQPLQNKL